MTRPQIEQRECDICQQVRRCTPVPLRVVEPGQPREEWLCQECEELMIEEDDSLESFYDEEDEDGEPVWYPVE